MLPAIRQKMLFRRFKNAVRTLLRKAACGGAVSLRHSSFSPMKKFLYKPLSSGRKYFFEDFKALLFLMKKSFFCTRMTFRRPIENTFQNCLACVSVLKSFFYARAASSTFTSSESLPVIKSPSGGGTSPLPPPAPCGRSLKDAACCAPSETQFPVSENVRIPPPAPSHAPEK